MKHIVRATLMLIAVAVLEARSLSQQTPHPVQPDATKGEVVLASLSKPTFSPLARQANVEGEVVVDVTVRQDGSTKSSVGTGLPQKNSPKSLECRLSQCSKRKKRNGSLGMGKPHRSFRMEPYFRPSNVCERAKFYDQNSGKTD